MAQASYTDWSLLLHEFAKYISRGDIILFDEISWMAHEDPAFVSKLKVWWDWIVDTQPHCLIVFCGSVSTWIEENILKSTAFFGRISLTITLRPLSLSESAHLLRSRGFKGSPYDMFRVLALCGGIPWYLEHIDPHLMGEENIKKLCFQRNGLLVLEFDRIFNDLFGKQGSTYKKILDNLKNGTLSLAEIRDKLAYAHSGTLSMLVKHLETAGFIAKTPSWSLKTESEGKQSLYRIEDPYIRFYLKAIAPNMSKIERDNLTLSVNQIEHLIGLDIQMGLQVEILLLQNRATLLHSIGVDSIDCRFDGPYRQSKTTRSRGCQIDYLVQSRAKNLYLCEFKFQRKVLGVEIIDEVKEKMERLSVPKGLGVVPVLYHLGGVSDTVVSSDFFYRIIDISDFLS